MFENELLELPFTVDHDIFYPQTFVNYSNYNFTQFRKLWIHKNWSEIIWKSIIITIIVILGLIGNSIIIILILRRPKFRLRSLNLFIMNLALANLFTVLFVPIVSLIENIFQNYQLGPFWCKFEILIKLTCILAGNLFIIVITFSRFINISFITNQNMKTNRRSLLVITIIWIIATSLAYPLAHMRVYHERQWNDYLEKWCVDYPLKSSINYWIFLMTPLIYLPLLIMIIVYSSMIYRINYFVNNSLANNLKSNDGDAENSMMNIQIISAKYGKSFQQKQIKQLIDETKLLSNKHKKIIIETMLIYCIITSICWLPLQILVYYRAFHNRNIPLPYWYESIRFFGQLLITTNAAINPYIMFGKTFVQYLNQRQHLHKQQRNLGKLIQLDIDNLILDDKHLQQQEFEQRPPHHGDNDKNTSDSNHFTNTNMSNSNSDDNNNNNNNNSIIKYMKSSIKSTMNKNHECIDLDRKQIIEKLQKPFTNDKLLIIQAPSTTSPSTSMTLSSPSSLSTSSTLSMNSDKELNQTNLLSKLTSSHGNNNNENNNSQIITKHMLQKYIPQLYQY